MASFRGLFSKVGFVLKHEAPLIGQNAIRVAGAAIKVERVVAPVVLPLLGPEGVAAEAIIAKGVDWAEAAIQIEQQGVAKKQGASAIITAELTNSEPIIEAFGLEKNFVPSPATLKAISDAIDAAVASRNALSALMASFRPATGLPPVASSGV